MGLKFAVSLSVTEDGRRAPEYQLDTDLNGEITLAALLNFTKSSLILLADQALREEQSKGFDKNPVVSVDGSTSKNPRDVNPLGKIEFTSRVAVDEMVLDTYNALLSRSPVLTGEYKDSHYVFLNGTQVAKNLPELTGWLASKPRFKDSDIIRFINITPYGRKLERLGVTAGNERYSTRSTRYQRARGQRGKDGGKVVAPNGAYYLTSRSIIRKYKNNSRIKFDFISGSSIGLTAKFKTPSKGRGKIRPARTYLYPSIWIFLSEGGIK